MPEQNDFLKMRVVYAIPGMENISARKNLAYKQLDDAALQLDVYMPPGLDAHSTAPAVIFIHGEAPLASQPKEWGCFVSYGQLLAASGCIGITFTHRPTERYARLHDAASDIDDLISYLAAHAADLQIDTDRIGIWAFSASGPYAVRAAFGETRLHIRCAAAYYAVMDLQHGREQIPDVDDETIQQFSPAYLVANNLRCSRPCWLPVRAKIAPSSMNPLIALCRERWQAISRSIA